MTSSKEETAPHHAEVAEPPNASRTDLSGDEGIIYELEHTGEEVGMTWRSAMAVASMALAYNSYLFTLVIPPAILSYINADIGPDPTYTWISISWNLGGAIFVTIGGRLSDIIGRRYFFLSGSGLLILGSIVGATGKSIGQMIASGTLFGCGSGFLEMAFGAVQEIVPNEYRMATIGVFDASSIIAQAMPLTAWAIIKYTQNWRIAYYIIIGFECFTFAVLFTFYHPPTFTTKHAGTDLTVWKVLKDFDWIGLFIFVAGCSLFIAGINWGGSLYPWASAATIAPIVIGFSLLVGLGFYETYGNPKEPLLPPRLFKEVREFTLPIMVICIAGMQYYSNAVLWPRMSQLIYASDEISKGLYAEVISIAGVIGGILIIGSKKVGHQRWQVFGAASLQTACVGAMSTATIDNPVKSIMLTFFISLCTTIIMMNCFVIIGFGIRHQRDIGTAAGLAGTARLLFGAVATAIFSNVTTNKYVDSLTGAIRDSVAGMNFPDANIAKLVAAARVGTPAAYAAVPGITPAIQAAAIVGNKVAYLQGTSLSYLVALAFGVIACVAAFFIPTINERKYTKKTVAVQETDRKALEDKKLAQA